MLLTEIDSRPIPQCQNRVSATNPPALMLTHQTDPATEPLTESILPARNEKKGRKRKNVCHDDRGFPDQSNEYDYLLQNVDSVRVLCMQQIHPMPPLDDIDPAFYSIFDEKLHWEMQNKEIDLTHLPRHVR